MLELSLVQCVVRNVICWMYLKGQSQLRGEQWSGPLWWFWDTENKPEEEYHLTLKDTPCSRRWAVGADLGRRCPCWSQFTVGLAWTVQSFPLLIIPLLAGATPIHSRSLKTQRLVSSPFIQRQPHHGKAYQVPPSVCIRHLLHWVGLGLCAPGVEVRDGSSS